MPRVRKVVPKRGRPTAAQAAQITQAIIAAAIENFLKNGFEEASMEAIAARANVPRSTLYKRYPDKTDLLRAVLEERLATWSTMAAEKDWMKPERLEERLKMYLSSIIKASAIPELRAFMRLTRSAWPNDTDANKRLDLIGYNNMVAVIERDVRELGPKQNCPAKDARRVAQILMMLSLGWSETGASLAGADEFADAAVNMIFQGKHAW
jgi:AcrR family transcriptional regulator